MFFMENLSDGLTILIVLSISETADDIFKV